MKAVVLDPQVHRGLHFKRYVSYRFTADCDFVPVVRAELGRLAGNYPLAFRELDGRFRLVAILSPRPGENLFVDARGNWLLNYVPAGFRGHPFLLLPAPAGPDGEAAGAPRLAGDFASGLFTPDPLNAVPLFDAEGRFSPALREIENFLRRVEADRRATQLAVDRLAAAGVFEPWSWSVTPPSGEALAVEGYYRVAERRLAGLDDATFLGLRRTAALAIAWAQIFSQGLIQNFAPLLQLRRQTVTEFEVTIDPSQTYI